MFFWGQTFHHKFEHFRLFVSFSTKTTKCGLLDSKELHIHMHIYIHIKEQMIFQESDWYEIKGQTIENMLTCCKDTDIFIYVL